MITTTPQRACTECGKLFFPHSANQSYHNDLCRQRAYRQRSKKRRGPKELTTSDYFNTYFAQVFQDVTPTTAQAIFKGAREDLNRRYAVLGWADPDNTTAPSDIAVDREEKDGVEYYNVHAAPSPTYLEASITERLTPRTMTYEGKLSTLPPNVQAIVDRLLAEKNNK